METNLFSAAGSASSSNQVWALIISSATMTLIAIIGGWVQITLSRINAQGVKSAAAVQTVADTLASTTAAADTKLNAIAKVADATHKLTNSNMGIQLGLVSSLAKEIAELKNDPRSAVRAIEAERAYLEHQAKQMDVDAKYPGGVPDAGV